VNIPGDEKEGERVSGSTERILPGSQRVFQPSPRGWLHAAWARLRAVLRLSVFLAASLALAAAYFVFLPWTFRSPARRTRLRNRIFGSWSRASLACAGVRVRVLGARPEAPCFLVSNHIVYFDIWVLGSETDAVFVAQSGIAAWPFFGFMARALSIIFVDRLNNRTLLEVNRRMEEEFARGQIVVLFPEGGTSRGAKLKPFRSSLLESPARRGHPVAWAAIGYRTGESDPPASEVVPWPDGVSIAAQAAKLLLLDRIEATVTFGEGTLRTPDRKELATELRKRVAAIFTPMV
jgi:1-acyl-sn-glycerol-3-phosphate acyltransferase